ncbi:MAG TPA: fatty acid cis/trans isomerase [Ideonella sp.]|uniref:fatty acid cis/trans isomerase n=1 Tax=Ideonella sp. TaxID=1929293 RepID=UPI002CD098B5|nr:fatty acid cis/trans isomerase [Ideonella sp.]HSI47751.1 fatty acid cis/trans isomerase [Ideonella sp.]
MHRFAFLLLATSLLAVCTNLVAPVLDPRFRPADPIGSYSNIFLRVKAADLPALQQLRSKPDFDTLARHWALRRTHPDFWAFSAALASTVAAVGRSTP